LQLFSVNEEFLVSTISSECADYVPVLCTHRPSLLPIECFSEIFGLVFRAALGSFGLYRKDAQTGSFRGSKSRNKVFVGEPAYGSLPLFVVKRLTTTKTISSLRAIIMHAFMCVHVIVSHHYVNNKSAWNFSMSMSCHFNFSTFNKSLLFVIEYESNREKHTQRKKYHSVRWITRLVIR
jgi:hypothetical protein